jgi:diguanylate cyclase (GGDEF)-like protein/PAS domain S-box-containing protein
MPSIKGKSKAVLEEELDSLLNKIDSMKLVDEERNQLIAKLREREQRYRILLDESSDPIFSFNREGVYLYINRAFAAPFKREPEDIIGKKIWDIFSQEEADKRFAMVKQVFETGETGIIEVRVPTPERDLYFITTVKPIFDANGDVATVICISKEITDRKRMEEELRHLSTHDLLTGLYNRNYFEVELERIQKSRNKPVVILLADLDGLKAINDSQGHHAGDELLRKVANSLKEVFRESDIIARIGGDEFAVLLPDTDSKVAQSLIDRLRQKFSEASEPSLSVSIGCSDNTNTHLLSDVMRAADDSMYREKELHKRKTRMVS